MERAVCANGSELPLVEQIDEKLVRWLTSVAGDDRWAVSLVADLQAAGAGVQAVLTDVRTRPVPRRADVPEVRVACTYLVTASGPGLAEEHRVLGRLLVAGAEGAVLDGVRLDLDVGGEPPPAAWWLAAGVKPRPAVVVRLQDRWARTVAAVPVVTGPLEAVDPLALALGVLRGMVVAANGAAIGDATVTVPPFPTVYRTDGLGRFQTGPVPLIGGKAIVRVRAKGDTQDVSVSDGQSARVVFESVGVVPAVGR